MTPLPGETTDEAAHHVLVVDDNEANRSLAQHALGDEGFRVTLASSGRAAIEAARQEMPGCVVLDVRMPDMDGFATCKALRALPEGGTMPIVFLTALRDIDTFDQALAVGGDDFLTKPVRPAELVARVRAALKLRQLREELREHYELLRRQRDTLLRVQLQKERLTAFVIHDLKNPVNAMDLHAQLLLREQGLSEGARESATHIRTEARQLNRMILNLLDLSKGDEGKLVVHRSRVVLPVLLKELQNELSASAEMRRVRVETKMQGESLEADPDLLRRILVNLTENAMRHAPVGSSVTVSERSEGGAVEFHVSDTGGGIPEAMRERIFDPFVRVEDSRGPQSRSGRGLGLAFCKLAVEAHGGTIWVEDAAPGAVFKFRIPQ